MEIKITFYINIITIVKILNIFYIDFEKKIT